MPQSDASNSQYTRHRWRISSHGRHSPDVRKCCRHAAIRRLHNLRLSRNCDYLSRKDVMGAISYCPKRKFVSDGVHSYCQQCTLDVERDKQMNAENEDAIRCGVRPPNEPQEDHWLLAERALSRLADTPAGQRSCILVSHLRVAVLRTNTSFFFCAVF